MANRRDFFFKQRVTEGELDDSNLQLELADHDIKKDAFCGANGFLMANVTVVQELAGTLRIDIGTGLGWDKDGQRVENPNASTFEDLSTHQDGALQVDVNVYMQFDRALSDPRTDGLGNTVNFKRDESFQIVVDAGAPGGGPPALDPTKGIILAEVAIPASPGVITNANIDTSVQNLKSDFPVERLKNFAPPFPNGFIGEIKIVRGAAPATQIEAERAEVSDTTNTKLLSVANKTADGTLIGVVGGLMDAGALAASTWYYLYVCGDSTGALADDVFLSINPGAPFGVAPTPPPGYDLFRRIGAVPTDGVGALISLRKINGITLYEQIDRARIFGPGLPPGGGVYTALATAPFVPPIAERCILYCLGQNGGGVGAQIWFRSGAADPAFALFGRTRQLEMSNLLETQSDNWLALEVDGSPSRNVFWTETGPTSGNALVDVVGFVDDMKYF